MKRYAHSIRVDVPAQQAWAVLSVIPRWPEWLPTVTSVKALDTDSLRPGARFVLRQPRLRPAIWTVTAMESARGFVWETHSPGVHIRASHWLRATAPRACQLDLQLDFSGVLGSVLGALLGRLTDTYLAREAAALKVEAEARQYPDSNR